MANIRENKKNGKVISFRFTVCLERDVRGKQIRKYTTWTAPADLTPAKARKAAERAADPPDALQNGGTELPHSFPRKDHGGARRIRRRRKAQRREHRVRLRRASDLPRYLANAGDRPHQRVCHRVAAQYIQQALSVIHAATGYFVEVISGEEEALFGYAGAMQELRLSGAFLDIGGASTEIVKFDGGTPVNFASFPIGSLSLYRRCVKKILPGEGSLKRLRQEISQTIDLSEDAIVLHPLLIGVGGTARAALKLAQHYCKISDDCHSITVEQLDALCTFLCGGKKAASDLILRLEAERIHTLVPGMLILQHVFHLFGAQQLVISKYGVREGYLWPCKTAWT